VTGVSHRNPERRAEREAAGWKDAPDNRILKCRWAFDRNREVMDMLPGSSGVSRRFYIGPEGLIDGTSQRSYNLDKVRTVGVTRPGSFFFLNGRNDRWETILTAPGAKVAVAQVGGATILSAEQLALKYELTLDPDTLLLRSVRGLAGGTEIYSVRIHSYYRDPASPKVFPKEATLRVTHPKTGVVTKEEQLKAISIEFPNARVAGGAFALTIPAGAAVGDRLLNRAIVPDKPTDAAGLLANPSQAKSQPYAENLPGIATESEPEVPYVPDRWLGWYWIIGLSAVAACAAFAAVRYLLAKPRPGS
jgi:hypothetical protein